MREHKEEMDETDSDDEEMADGVAIRNFSGEQTPELLVADDESLVDKNYMRKNTYATADDPSGDMESGLESALDKNINVRASMPSSEITPFREESKIKEVDE